MSLDEKILESLDEEEIKVVVQHMSTNLLLIPLKSNQKMYSQQIKRLGRMDAKSPLVQKMLPAMVLTLMKKQDVKYTEIISKYLCDTRRHFEDYLKENEIGNALSHDVPESYASLYWTYRKDVDKSCDLSYFWIMLKLVGDELDATEQTRIEYCVEQQENNVQMVADYENRIEQSTQEHQVEIEQLKKKHSKEIKDLQQEIRSLSDLIQGKKDSLEEIWERETDKKHVQRMRTLDEEYEQKKVRQEEQYHESNNQLECEYQEKKNRLLVEIEEQTERLKAEYETRKQTLSEDIQNLESRARSLSEKESVLQSEIESLESRKSVLQAYIDHYFQQFEEHAIQMSLDALLKSKFAENAFSSSQMELGVRTQTIHENVNELLVHEGTPIKNGDYIDPAEELEDMLMDLKENIGRYFEDPYEIAKLVLTAQSLGKVMLIDSFSARKIGDSISALTDGKCVTTIDLSDGKYTIKEVIDFINNRPEITILVEGLIDRFDDKVIASIYHGCPGTIVIFSYAEKATLDMLSKAYLQYDIPFCFEEKITLESSEPILLSNQIYQDNLPDINIEECKKIYKKHFSKLYREGYLTKSLALEVTKFIEIYKALENGGKVSGLAKETIRFFLSNLEEEKENQVLLKDLI